MPGKSIAQMIKRIEVIEDALKSNEIFKGIDECERLKKSLQDFMKTNSKILVNRDLE